MQFQEGQIFEGEISLTGEQGPLRHWIVVSPFGKLHVHSIDDPLFVHCWPAHPLATGIADGRVRLLGFEPAHPVIRLQRAKERAGIEDTHMGLHGYAMERMLNLLESAVAAGEDYAEYAAGEILGLMSEARYRPDAAREIRNKVADLIRKPLDGMRGLHPAVVYEMTATSPLGEH